MSDTEFFDFFFGATAKNTNNITNDTNTELVQPSHGESKLVLKWGTRNLGT